MYLTLEDIKAVYPSLPDNQLTDIGNSLSLIIDEYCNTTFGTTKEATDLIDSQRHLKPNKLPLVSVTALSDDGVARVENVDFFTYRDHIFLETPSKKRKSLSMTYTYGYSEVPELVARVASELLNYYESDAGTDPRLRSQNLANELTYEKFNDASELRILRKLNRYKVGIRQIRLGRM